MPFTVPHSKLSYYSSTTKLWYFDELKLLTVRILTIIWVILTYQVKTSANWSISANKQTFQAKGYL